MFKRFLIFLLSLLSFSVPTSVEPGLKYAALTFDDGPSGMYTRELLDGLRERNVKATFFLCGYRIMDYPEEAERIAAEGHEIGSHGYSHQDMRGLSRRAIAKELTDTQALLPEKTRVRFFRPPGGCCNDAIRQVAEARNLAILSWTVDPRDWATEDAAQVEAAILEQVTDGAVILMHDMSHSSVTAALNVIDRLQEEGYRFVTVSELAAMRDVSVRAGKTYREFPRR